MPEASVGPWVPLPEEHVFRAWGLGLRGGGGGGEGGVATQVPQQVVFTKAPKEPFGHKVTLNP